MAVRQYEVRLESVTPLLMHRDDVNWADQMEEWLAKDNNRKNSKAGDDRFPAFKWIGYVYHDGSTVCLGSDNIARCLLDAGAMVTVGTGKKTFKQQTQSGMKVDAPYIPLLLKGDKVLPWGPIDALRNEPDFKKHLEAASAMGFSLFTKRAKIGGATGTKHVRVRPRFDNWALQFTVSVWDEQITMKALEAILKAAGNYKGLGDWRPSSPKVPGSYGLFELKWIKEIK